MRAHLVSALLVTVVVVAGLAGVVSGVTAGTPTPTATGPTATEPPSTRNETTLRSREELYAAIDDHAGENTASLYYVAENGTWFHATPDGSIESTAPEGQTVPRIADETHEVGPEERPVYLWKVVSDDECDTTFYDASNVSDATTYAIPSCPPPSPPSNEGTPPSAGDETSSDGRDGRTTTETVTVAQPGFGVVVAVLALLCAGLVARR